MSFQVPALPAPGRTTFCACAGAIQASVSTAAIPKDNAHLFTCVFSSVFLAFIVRFSIVDIYNSCRNRHCPKCHSLAKAKWLEARQSELLPVTYYHVVFTLPDSLAQLALQNARVIYNLLFRAVSETLLRIAADPKRLGARIGFFAVLHTWGQTLMLHPHLHCVVPAGGLSPGLL